MKSRQVYTFTSVGTGWAEVSLTAFPDKFIITRAKASILSGTGATVALSIREQSGETGILEYDLVPEVDYPVDECLVHSFKVRDSDIGKIWIAVQVDSGSDTSIRVTLEYEAA